MKSEQKPRSSSRSNHTRPETPPASSALAVDATAPSRQASAITATSALPHILTELPFELVF
jgi:hypothetical protein